MVNFPRIGRLRIPRGLARGVRARVRAQRAWWRRRWRATAPGPVLFPESAAGMVAVGTLAGGARRGPRIAILHATAGSGHRRAAQAIAAAIAELEPAATVREVDTLVFASGFYRSTYARGYNVMAARAPRLWGLLYHSWEAAPLRRGTPAARLLDRLNLRRLARVVEHERPDAVVCTHFLPVEALEPLRARGRMDVPLFGVVTDFAVHPFWAMPRVDGWFVAGDRAAEELAAHGVPRERIEVTGIPVDPGFAAPLEAAEARARMGLDAMRPVVLVMGGGHGVGPLAELAGRLAALPAAPQVVVVCGTNEALRAEVAALPAAAAGHVRALGYTHEVDALLAASDALVSKAGGLTCSEALVRAVPMVIFRPTPGQEVRNAEILEAAGAAVRAASLGDVERAVARILEDPAHAGRMRAAARALGRPDAARAVARRVLAAIAAGARRA
uniref:Galactosyldiacylglycerol synthase n=1 Tax=Eiseniibacteriota bacterium TaxID=2212470 RepID=A0A832I797_UNCEI